MSRLNKFKKALTKKWLLIELSFLNRMLNIIERINKIIVEERKTNSILGPHSEILLIKKANTINRINIL